MLWPVGIASKRRLLALPHNLHRCARKQTPGPQTLLRELCPTTLRTAILTCSSSPVAHMMCNREAEMEERGSGADRALQTSRMSWSLANEVGLCLQCHDRRHTTSFNDPSIQQLACLGNAVALLSTFSRDRPTQVRSADVGHLHLYLSGRVYPDL